MQILVLGAGRMGGAIVYDLLRSPAVRAVGVADKSRAALTRLARHFASHRLRLHPLDATDERATTHLLRRYQAAASALPYWQNVSLTRAAIRAGVPLCDLGGSHAVRAAQQRFHAAVRRRGITILPDCGLAPGIASVLVAHGAEVFERLGKIQIRVGGLPRRPQPPLGYALYFSPEGLINEYAAPVEIVTRGRRRQVAPLTGLEAIHFRGLPPLEAFYTSGGSSTLPRSFRSVPTLEEKTIRYQGHCEKIRVLQAMGFFSSRSCSVDDRPVRPRELLARLLEERRRARSPTWCCCGSCSRDEPVAGHSEDSSTSCALSTTRARA